MKGAAYFKEFPERHPAWLAEEELGLALYPKQIEALHSVAVNRHTAVCAANGSGKTTKIIAPIIIWWLSIMCGKVVFTSASWGQIQSQLLPAIREHSDKLGQSWDILEKEILCPNGEIAVAISTDHPGRFEGHHGTELQPLLIVADEAKSILEVIFTAIDRCTYQRLLLTSSTGLMRGTFYKACTDKSQGYHVVKITADDCPHITDEKKREIIDKYGIDHPQTRSQLYSEFMGDDDVAAACKPVKIHLYERCRENPPAKARGNRVAFCDFAAGGDENVLAIVDGNILLEPITCRERDTTAGVGWFIREFRKAGLEASDIWGDEGGLGRAMIDSLREAGWDINRVNNNEASEKDDYANTGAEIWYEGAKAIEHCQVVLPPDLDETLKGQMTGRDGSLTSKGKLVLEPKDKMKKRGLSSPDRADAALGAIWARQFVPSRKGVSLFDGDTHDHSDQEDEQVAAHGGAWAG